MRAMIELALNWQERGIYQKDIAEKQSISYKYLDHIIAALKAHGLIENVEGKKSGYRLSRSPENITIYDIYKAFEPEIQIVQGNDNVKLNAARDLWDGLNKVIKDYLKAHNLKELADKQIELNTISNTMFVI
jgi:Rrf2 family protein